MARLGRYELGRPLGEGGAGRVYEATLCGPGGLRRPVALKVLHRGDAAAVRHEARLGGLLRHRHLVDVFEVGEDRGRWFCAMELCRDGSLADHLPLPPAAVVEVGLQVCAALQYAHEQLGLVHLDLKPQNLLLDGPVVKVADLGIARADGFGHADGVVRGTPGYMAPEQARGGPVDARSDLYALGVTLLELATGARHRASETMSVDALDAPGAVAPPVPEAPWLSDILDRCLEPTLSARFPDMAALSEALRALDADGPGLREALQLEDRLPSTGDRADDRGADPLLGRDDALDALDAMLARPGLYCLKGPGGIGKTRLAEEAARRWAAQTGATAAVCHLSGARDLTGLLRAVAGALEVGLGIGDASALVDRLGAAIDRLGDVLVVLDNFEHLLALAWTADRWRLRAPGARLLITSRAPLRLHGEVVVPVEPLAEEAAISLLVARARARGADVRGDPAVTDLARRLEGVPLALELAAGRIGVLTVDEVLDRLDLSLLRSAGDDRQATLRSVLAWSWSLLSDAERRALEQLSVFRGGFALESAEAVIACPAGMAVVDLVQALLDKSLVHPASGGRFRLLVTVQDFAREQLTSAALREVERRHSEHFGALAKGTSFDALNEQGGADRTRALARELENMKAALRCAIARGDTEAAVHTAFAANAVLQMTGPFSEAAELAEAAMQVTGATGLMVACLRVVAAWARQNEGRHAEAAAHNAASLAYFRSTGDTRREARVLHQVGTLHAEQGRLEPAREAFEAALAIERSGGVRRQEGVLRDCLGMVHWLGGRPVSARAHFEAALAAFREVGDRRSEAIALSNLARADLEQSRTEEVAARLDAAIEAATSFGDQWLPAEIMGLRARLDARRGQHERARKRFAEALAVLGALGSRRTEGILLAELSKTLLACGLPEEARHTVDRALAIHREIGNGRGEGRAQIVRAALLRAEEDGAAAGALESAAALCAGAGDRLGEARARRRLAALHLGDGRFDDARACVAAAEPALQEAEDLPELEALGRIRAGLERT